MSPEPISNQPVCGSQLAKGTSRSQGCQTLLVVCVMKLFVSPRLPRYQQKGWPYSTMKCPPLPGCKNSLGNYEYYFWVAAHKNITLNTNKFDSPVVEDGVMLLIFLWMPISRLVWLTAVIFAHVLHERGVRGGATGPSLAWLLDQLHLKVVHCGISSGKEVLRRFFVTPAYFVKNGMDADGVKENCEIGPMQRAIE